MFWLWIIVTVLNSSYCSVCHQLIFFYLLSLCKTYFQTLDSVSLFCRSPSESVTLWSWRQRETELCFTNSWGKRDLSQNQPSMHFLMSGSHSVCCSHWTLWTCVHSHTHTAIHSFMWSQKPIHSCCHNHVLKALVNMHIHASSIL